MLARDKDVCITVHRVELERDIGGLGRALIFKTWRRDGEGVVSVGAHTYIVGDSDTLLEDIVVLLRVHGSDRELSEISILATLTLDYHSVVAFTAVKVLAGIFIMINNNTETFANSFPWYKSRLRSCQTLIFDTLAAFHRAIIF